MPVISKEQIFAITRGFLVQKAGAAATQKFTGISPSVLLNPGLLDSTTTNLATGVATVTVASTANYKVGMSIQKISGAGAFFNGSPLCVYSKNDNGTVFTVGNYPEKILDNLTATLESNNIITITSSHDTSKIVPGLKVTKVSGDGAFNATGCFVKEITGPKTFTVVTTIDSSSVPGSTAATHATIGAIVFYVGGVTRNHATAGAITSFLVGGIDFPNNAIYGLGDLNPAVYTLATGSSTIGGEVVARFGGDINGNGGLANIERDYHFTGQCLIRKLK